MTDKFIEDAKKAIKRGEYSELPPLGDSKRPWKDPACPKCGIVLGNRMSYACGHSYCPSGLN